MAGKQSFWLELQRRHVVRAAVGHIVVFWLLVQIADVVLPYVGIVDQPVRWAFVAGVALFPVTLIVAWFVEHPWHELTSSRVFLDIAIITAIAVTAGVWVMKNLPQVVHTRTSIVVLPFSYPPEDPLGQSLSRAMALEVNSLLMKSRSIDVMGYESASSPALQGLDIADIIKTLGVQNVLSGVISTAEASMSVTVHLHDESGREVWSAEVERSLEDLYAVQENIAQEIQSRLGETDTGVPVGEVAGQRCPMPTNPDALERYYTARHYVESRTDSDESRAQLLEAVALYESLIEQYPEFAQAYSGLAWALRYRGTYDSENAGEDTSEENQVELAKTAYGLCETLGEALVFLPNDADHPNPWIGTEQNLELWMAMQPESIEARQALVFQLRMAGRITDALRLAEETYRLNPLSVRSIKLLMQVLMYENRMEEALALEARSFELGSTAPPFASQMNALEECDADLDCILENLPPPFSPYKEQLRDIYMPPEDFQGEQAKVEQAMGMIEQMPFLTNWFNGSSCRFEHLTELYPRLWDNAQATGTFWFWPNTWRRECERVWQSPEFPRVVEEAGLVEYWRAKQWTDACEPAGDAFECSGEIWRAKRLAAGLAVGDAES